MGFWNITSLDQSLWQSVAAVWIFIKCLAFKAPIAMQFISTIKSKGLIFSLVKQEVEPLHQSHSQVGLLLWVANGSEY